MAMPNELVLIRHGESEANIVQKRDDHGVDPEITRNLFLRPDWKHRLTPAGVEQATQAGEWIAAHIGGVASFDALYVSPFLRTRETAAYLGGMEQGDWTIDDRLVERSWGVYGKLPRAEQRAEYPRTAEEKRLNPWYTRLDGGESMPDVYARFRSFQETLHRERAGQRVLAVTHGDFINATRYGVERMTPEEWEQLDEDARYTIRNCTILQYSRINPHDPEDIRDKIHWRRYTYPNNPAASPDGGEWIELAARRRYLGSELLKQVEVSARLIP
jgi:broad specificity phosphatase PhoE